MSAVAFLAVRGCTKPKIHISTGDADAFADFLSADDSNALLNLVSKGVCFTGTSVMLLVSTTVRDEMTDQTVISIWIQLILSIIQALCFAFYFFVPINECS